jgi:hypothetical protein
MSSEDVKETLDLAVAASGVDTPKVHHRPRLLSDNGACYIAKDLQDYLVSRGMGHTRGKPYHPMTQGNPKSLPPRFGCELTLMLAERILPQLSYDMVAGACRVIVTHLNR